MRRVVITGLGIVSSLGNNKDEVKSSLYNASSGISFDQSQKEMGFRSQVSGQIDLNLEETIERKFLRFMGDGASYNYIAMNEAIEDSRLNEDEISPVASNSFEAESKFILFFTLSSSLKLNASRYSFLAAFLSFLFSFLAALLS